MRGEGILGWRYPAKERKTRRRISRSGSAKRGHPLRYFSRKFKSARARARGGERKASRRQINVEERREMGEKQRERREGEQRRKRAA